VLLLYALTVAAGLITAHELLCSALPRTAIDASTSAVSSSSSKQHAYYPVEVLMWKHVNVADKGGQLLLDAIILHQDNADYCQRR
jgi:hypothetical protein